MLLIMSTYRFDYADKLDNAINIVTQGDIPEWLDASIPDTNQTLFSALGYVATASNLMRIAAQESVGGGADKGDILNLIRDVGSKVTTYWADAFTSVGSGALSVSMGGVLIIDKMLTAFAEEAQSTKLEDIEYVYHHYNEGFTSAAWAHKLMKPKDWREQVIKVLEKHPYDADIAIAALEAGFRKYATDFFALSDSQMAEVASDVPNVTVKRIPNFTDAEKEQLIERYIAHLKNKTMPAVLTSVREYMVKKSEEAQLASINAIKDYYNSTITVTIEEQIPEGEKSQYAGFKFRFAPLNETGKASETDWTGNWPKSGKVTFTSTLIGFMTAGYPHTVEFFKPDANMDTDKPEFTVPFVISVPTINITFGNGKFKTKDNTFFGVTLPIPDIGTVTEFNTEVNGWGEEVTTIRIDGMSYEQYIEYCKILEALPGWEVYEGSFPEDVAHFPEDYNSQSKVDFSGSYKSLPHISVHYYSDKQCEKNGYPHFCMFIFRNWD